MPTVFSAKLDGSFAVRYQHVSLVVLYLRMAAQSHLPPPAQFANDRERADHDGVRFYARARARGAALGGACPPPIRGALLQCSAGRAQPLEREGASPVWCARCAPGVAADLAFFGAASSMALIGRLWGQRIYVGPISTPTSGRERCTSSRPTFWWLIDLTEARSRISDATAQQLQRRCLSCYHNRAAPRWECSPPAISHD